MSFGAPKFTEHVVEFVRGTGIVTDGVTDATSVNGPWTWVVPVGVTQVTLNGTGAGGGGGGGGTTGVSRGGGGGGCAGLNLSGVQLPVLPNASLTITLGAGGTAGAAGGAGGASGASTVVGVNRFTLSTTAIGTFRLPSVTGGGAGAATGGASGTLGNASTAAGGTSAASPGAGGTATSLSQVNVVPPFGGAMWCTSGGGGGGASTAGTTAGASGGGTPQGQGGQFWNLMFGFASTQSSGNTDATNSYGGGGWGGLCFYGLPGAPGNGNAAATAGSGFGYGGAGGGGNAAGVAGGDAYLQLTYWSAA